jgi:uncharacterized membrane protein YoaK (UPF0700 family)
MRIAPRTVAAGTGSVVRLVTGTGNESAAGMSLTFVLAACVFVAVVGAVVACVDRWRDSRLVVTRPAQRVDVPVGRIPVNPAPGKRAA